MILIKTAGDLFQYLSRQKSMNHTVGFVPTMGALHQGHISLVEAALKHTSICVCSIFVNPTQFNDDKDYKIYPVTIEQDVLMLEKAGCHVLFLPAVTELYPQGTERNNDYDLGYLGTVYEGAYRPGHFQGVCQVVEKLLKIVRPDQLFLGQKDYQQCEVIKQLIHQSGWQNDMEVKVCPTLREPDGLALSSRNRRIADDKRTGADGIYKALTYLKNNLHEQPIPELIDHANEIMTAQGFETDYLAIVDAHTLKPVTKFSNDQSLVALVAATYDEVRLIDNMILTGTQ